MCSLAWNLNRNLQLKSENPYFEKGLKNMFNNNHNNTLAASLQTSPEY